MKSGDLVKHPQGIVNVCKDTYSSGLILESHLAGPDNNRIMQHLVWWCNHHGAMQYSEEELEVISESR